MAWNEPGGGKDQDPWGNRGRRPNSNDGPPDLDEALKQLTDKLSGIFGGGGGGSRGSGGGASKGSFVLMGLVALGLWVVSGVFFVGPGEKAMILQFGKYHTEVGAGAHWVPRFIQSYYKVDVETIKSYPHATSMLTKDTFIVDVGVSVQYQVSDPRKYFLQVADAEMALQFATQSAIRHVVGSLTMDEVLTEGREEIELEVIGRLREYLQVYDAGLSITKVNLERSDPPEPVKEAFDDVTRAREDESRFIDQADAYLRSEIPKARGQAERILKDAEAYKKDVIADAAGEVSRFTKVLQEYQKAPEVTRQRMYLETLESIYGTTSKVIVDGSASNNLLYLPLDKMVAGGAGNSAVSRSERTNPPRPTVSDSVNKSSARPRQGQSVTDDLRNLRSWGG